MLSDIRTPSFMSRGRSIQREFPIRKGRDESRFLKVRSWRQKLEEGRGVNSELI